VFYIRVNYFVFRKNDKAGKEMPIPIP